MSSLPPSRSLALPMSQPTFGIDGALFFVVQALNGKQHCPPRPY